jgi:hypothetical protein
VVFFHDYSHCDLVADLPEASEGEQEDFEEDEQEGPFLVGYVAL